MSGERLASKNNHFHLWMENNGNVELHRYNRGDWNVIWASQSNVSGSPPYKLYLNKETNELEVHDTHNKITWKSGVSASSENTFKKGGHAILKNNGDFVVHDRKNVTMWSSGTKGGKKSEAFGTGIRHEGKFFILFKIIVFTNYI